MVELRCYDHKNFKITVEELQSLEEGYYYMTTHWRKSESSEADAKVYRFKIHSLALAQAADLLAEEITAITKCE